MADRRLVQPQLNLRYDPARRPKCSRATRTVSDRTAGAVRKARCLPSPQGEGISRAVGPDGSRSGPGKMSRCDMSKGPFWTGCSAAFWHPRPAALGR